MKEEEERRWERRMGLDGIGRTSDKMRDKMRDKIRGEAGKVYIPPRYLIPMYTLYAVRYTL